VTKDYREVTAMTYPRISIPLDIPDVRVLDVQVSQNGDYVITIESTIKTAHCRRCGQVIGKFQGYDDWVTLRHLSILGHPVYLRYRPKRYCCLKCDGKPTTTQQVSWHKSNSPQTKTYEDHVLLQLVNATIEDVSVKERLGYDAVLGIVERRIAARVDWSQFRSLDVLGLDEIALKKGHRDFVVIVTARLANQRVVLLAVLPDREKDTVVQFLRSIPEALRKTIHTVCSDMYPGYINAVKEVLQQALVVIDRFHVAKLYREGADALRKQELKRLRQELPEAEYKQLKGSLWAFRKNKADLTPSEAELLARLFSHSSQLELAYTFREELTAIFELKLSKSEAQVKIQDWQGRVRGSSLTCFDSFLGTLDERMDEISNYFVNRHNSGYIEGLNNKLKVLKRRCYGLLNLDHLFQRISLDLEGYRLYGSRRCLSTTTAWGYHGNSQ
jgi:transposase